MSIKKYISEHQLLIVIIVIATILRCWNLFEIPLTHDEVSTLNRTQFDTFSDLIEFGVKPDTHPPGVQVFTYYWVKLFGDEQWVVKLPFLLMGIGCLPLAYSIFKRWSNETAALLIISFLATLQFTVMYSQIARPYVSGMFLVLCMVYFWDKLVNRPEQNFWKNLVLTVVFGAACAYNHHFSLLASFLIGVTGVFVVQRKYVLKYLILGVLIVLLYLPNLSIFLHQLDRGGVGEWLGEPTPQFILDFFSYSFNHSIALMISFVAIVTVGIYSFKKSRSFKWVLISGIWFFGVWVIGYYYSVKVNPVLQPSMLIFLFPFMLFSLLGWIPELQQKTKATLVVLVLLVGTTSLTFHRKHFEVFYANRYFQMKEDAAQYDEEKTCFVFATYPHFLEINFPRNIDIPTGYLAWEEKVNTLKEFEEYIINCDKNQLFLGHVEQFPKELIAIAHIYYPNLVEVNYVSGAASYLFSRGWEYQDLSYNGYHDVLAHPTMNNSNGVRMSSGTYADSSTFSLGTTIDIQSQLEHEYDLLVVSTKINLSNEKQDVKLVAEFKELGVDSSLHYSANSSDLFYFNPKDSTVHVVIALSMDVLLNHRKTLPELKTYIWNPNEQPLKILDYRIELWEGNRNKYCLWKDF